MADKIFPCPHCDFKTDKDSGWRKHMSMSHQGYHRHELQKAGIEENAGDRIRALSGYGSLDEVRAAAPESEGEGPASGQQAGTMRASRNVRTPRLSKDEQEKIRQQEEFERLRPMLVKKWERRLKMLYGTWARIADDKSIALEGEEAKEGAEQHVELMIAFGWVHAGKIEAIMDVCMWHGGAILGRSQIGQQLMASFSGDDPTKDMSPGERDEYLRKAKEHLQ